jgi:tetratricopeptide (TPR) repeat protein
VALGVRLLYLYQSAHNPTFLSPIVDAKNYHVEARALAEHGVMGFGFLWQPFFYPFVLSVLYIFTGSSILAVRIFQGLLGAVTCWLTYRLGRRAVDTRTGVAAGLITAFCGPLIFYECELVAAAWAAFWSVVLMLLLLRAERTRTAGACFAVGLCGAAAILTRPTFLPFFAITCVWLLVVLVRHRADWAALAAPLGALCGGFLLIASPVALLTQRATGQLSILPVSGGLNAYIGNNPHRAATLAIRPETPQWDDLIEPSVAEGLKTDTDQARLYYRRVREYARAQPLDFLRGLGEKALQFGSGREIPRNEDLYLFREWSSLLRALAWKAGGFGFPWGVLLPLAVAGLLLRWRQVPPPLLLFVLLYPLAIISAFVSSRYRVPVIPLFSILGAAGCVGVVDLLRGKRWGRAAAALGLVSALGVAISLPGPFPEEQVNYASELHVWLGDNAAESGQNAQAKQEYEQALALDPDSYLAHAHLAQFLAKAGDFRAALAHWDTLLRRDPQPRTYVLRGDAYLQQHDFASALRDYNRAIDLKPDLARAYCQRGNLYYEQGRLDQARQDWEHVLQLYDTGRAAEEARQRLQRLRPTM